MRVQLVDRPRIESTRTSSTRSRAAAAGYRAFQRSRPASASALRAALATVMSGWVDSRWPRRSELGPGAFRLDGGTRRLVPQTAPARWPARMPQDRSPIATTGRSAELVEKRLRFFEVGCIEAFGEPAVNRREEIAGFDSPALVAAQPG